ncbi:NAD(P)/FAD-dependent oxidoreductase [Domibacillus epiphyticus]|uniref:Pyridine nucleotide-disulfide oxidoreductase n=1 Tax=Domibacillus epiphyticus TaxID=1714355 RepID=A0A1V2A5A4_9BACI|nr:NAD(P)/FAD-dependent oxidoreductase [Domibacillus epiphyticus]OMP66146.1 pyridine nucleotide-disulfide oxidoreductase [Domibacillus epiphyticus]
MRSDVLDVVIAGGGPGGLSAALVLGRSLKHVLVIDEGKPRNGVTVKSHGFLTRDGSKPGDIRQIAQEQMAKYKNVSIIEDIIDDVVKENGLFTSTTRSGKKIISKKIIFSTGMKDHLPAILGLHDVYGKTVFHCPYCDGWERKNEPLAIFGNGKELFPFIKLIYNWSQDLIVFSNGPAIISDTEKKELEAHGIGLVETPIAEFQSNDGILEQIVLIDGDAISRKGGFMLTTGEKQSSMIPARLGIPINEQGQYETNEHGDTNIEGLFIIGDAKNTFTSIVGAASQGYETGVKINGEFAEEKWSD